METAGDQHHPPLTHPAHRESTIAALDAGSHVLVEKPLASSLEDCDAMIEAANRNNRYLGTISQRRFYAPSMRIRHAIDSGKIGKPVLGTIQMLGWRDEAHLSRRFRELTGQSVRQWKNAQSGNRSTEKEEKPGATRKI